MIDVGNASTCLRKDSFLSSSYLFGVVVAFQMYAATQDVLLGMYTTLCYLQYLFGDFTLFQVCILFC